MGGGQHDAGRPHWGKLHSLDAGRLRELYPRFGDFLRVSVYLETSRTSPDAGKQTVPVRWRDQREELEREGAERAALDALNEALAGRASPGTAAFGRAGMVPLVAGLREPPLRELARWAPLPHVMPLLVQSPPQSSHLVVSANRAGGEVLAVHTPEDAAKERVEGTGWPVHRTKVGGWSQLEHRRATEEAWETNAKELAAVRTGAAAQTKPEFVVVAGDVRARGMLIDKLPADLKSKTVVVERELPVDSGELAEAAGEALRAAADSGTGARLESYRSHLGTGRATEGLTEEDLRERGVADLQQDRMDAALIRAMVGTDAELFLVPGEEAAPQEDIGALLRFAAPLV